MNRTLKDGYDFENMTREGHYRRKVEWSRRRKIKPCLSN